MRSWRANPFSNLSEVITDAKELRQLMRQSNMVDCRQERMLISGCAYTDGGIWST